MTCLSVLGAGKIGGEVAYLASVLGIIDTLVIYDVNAPFLRAQVLDLMHAGLDIEISTDPWKAKESDICVFAAGFPRDPSVKTRADLLRVNLPVAEQCSRPLHDYEGVLITVTNPMDVNNYFFAQETGMDPKRCIGFGGQLDSARYAIELRKRGIMGQAWVLGDHGEHQVPVFSTLPEVVPLATREEVLADMRKASMEVIQGKGGTVFGPAWHIADLIRKVDSDSRSLVTCSCVLNGEYGIEDCSLGVPARVGRDGIHKIEEWELDDWELSHLQEAGEVTRELCRNMND
jgi:malate dehydrogenase